ncbi:MAG: prolyl oligopeptidase family serine peptidase [Candidatus Komeilibacteria bacterium]
MNKKIIFILLSTVLISFIALIIFFIFSNQSEQKTTDNTIDVDSIVTETKKENLHPMSIESLRNREYVGGDFIIEEKLSNGINYKQYIVSYKSEGLKVYGLLMVPLVKKPKNGFPSIVFVHGYIPPKQYSTTESYPTYPAYLARNGFIVFKPDLRGHGNSEGDAVGAHFSEKYVVDTLYAISYLKNYTDVDPNRIGYWGHSNGGEIGLRMVTISSDIKAASFWAGVVGSYEDMLETYNDKIGFLRNAFSASLVIENGLPSENPNFWNKLDPYLYLSDIQAPIQLQHGTKDDSVPIELSLRLKEELEKLNKSVEYYEYIGDNHDISNNVDIAFQRTVNFYNKNLPEINNIIHEPISNSLKRVTKKPFGIKIDIDNSPVQPEKFSGYHTGVDFEIFTEEENLETDILAICVGPLISKRQMTGYGGVVVQRCEINNEPVTVIYGHLKLESISNNLDDNLDQGQKIGILGQSFSTETDGERKHLHLGIHRGENINLLGYVQDPQDLVNWIDYQSLINN